MIAPLTVYEIGKEYGDELSNRELVQKADILILIYSKFAYSYGLVSALEMTAKAREEMQRAVLDARRLFFRLVRAVAAAAKAREQSQARLSRASSVISVAGFVEEVSNKGTVTVDNLLGWTNRPNMHVALHFGSAAEQFSTMWNVSVFLGENYHRIFKRQVMHTNKQNPELTLLRRELRHKMIQRLSSTQPRSSIYANEFKELCVIMVKLRISLCPTLMEYFLHQSEQRFLDQADEQIFLDYSKTQENARVTSRILRE